MKFLGRDFQDAVCEKAGKQSMRELSPIVGVSHTTLSRILNDEQRIPDLETYAKICNWLGCSMNKFFDKSTEDKLKSILDDFTVLLKQKSLISHDDSKLLFNKIKKL